MFTTGTPTIETHALTGGRQQHLMQLQRVTQHFRGEVFSDSLVTTSESLKAYHEEHPQEREREPDGTFAKEANDKFDIGPEPDAMAIAQQEFDQLMKEIP